MILYARTYAVLRGAKHSPLIRICPRCGAPAGYRCRDLRSNFRHAFSLRPHPERCTPEED